MKKSLLTFGIAGALPILSVFYVFAANGNLTTDRVSAISANPQLAQALQETSPSVSVAKTTPPVLTGERIVLRLSYHGRQPDAPLHPNRISFYFERNESSTFHQGGVICTDWQSNIYVYDPVSPSKGVIKKFDSTGKLVHTFELPAMPYVLSASVTRQGTLWVGVGTKYIPTPGLPVIAFRAEDTKPFLDWRVNMPEQLKQVTQKSTEQDATTKGEKVNTYWRLDNIVAGATKVRVRAAYSHSEEDRRPVLIQINFNGDVPSELQVEPIEAAPKSEQITGSTLSPDDSQWFVTTGKHSGDWENKWFWKQGQPQGAPLIRRKELLDPQGWWQKTFALKKGEDTPALRVDGSDNVYQIWIRQSEDLSRKFYMGSGIEEMSPKASEGEKALVVLNAQRQIIGYLPWTLCYFELFENWIFPLPDGSGFYRQEYTPKELVVYFYPLPKSKTQEPQ